MQGGRNPLELVLDEGIRVACIGDIQLTYGVRGPGGLVRGETMQLVRTKILTNSKKKDLQGDILGSRTKFLDQPLSLDQQFVINRM